MSASLRERLEDARRSWPGVTLADDVYAAAVEARVAAGVSLERLHTADLFLAEACARGDVTACAAFSDLVAAVIPASAPAEADDVRQLVCERMLVATDGPPRIASYTGAVKLSSWLRVIAARIAIDAHRRKSRERPLQDSLVADLEADGIDPTLDELKAKYRARFKTAVAVAIGKLSEKDRGVLRFTIEQHLTADEIGRIYGAHRVTVARWIRRIRDALAAEIISQLGVEEVELASMLRLVRSQVSLSLGRVLAR